MYSTDYTKTQYARCGGLLAQDLHSIANLLPPLLFQNFGLDFFFFFFFGFRFTPFFFRGRGLAMYLCYVL